MFYCSLSFLDVSFVKTTEIKVKQKFEFSWAGQSRQAENPKNSQSSVNVILHCLHSSIIKENNKFNTLKCFEIVLGDKSYVIPLR